MQYFRYFSILLPSRQSDGLHARSLAFQTAQVFVTRIGGLGVALLSNLALTRWLGISVYGEFIYIIAWVTILCIPGSGMGTLVVRETAMALYKDDDATFAGLMRWSLVNTLWTSCALALLGYLAFLFNAAHPAAKPTLALTLGLAAIPFLCIQTVAGSVFRGRRRVELAVLLNEIAAPGLLAAWAGVCLLAGFKSSASMALGGRLAAAALVLSAYALLLPRLNFRWRWQKASRHQLSSWRKSMCSLAFLNGVGTMDGRLPVLMLGIMIGPEPVALFSLSSRIAETVSLTLSIVALTTGPRLAELHAKRDYRGMQQLATRSTAAISVWAVPVALGLILAGRWLLGWFGPRFSDGYPLLVVLVIGQTVNAITGTAGLVMNMGGLERISLKVRICGLALTALFCAVLIPVFGPVGAAIGATVALIFWNITLAFQLFRRLGIASSFYTPGFINRPPASRESASLENTKETR